MVDIPEIGSVKVTVSVDGPALDASLAEARAKIATFDNAQVDEARRRQAEMLASLQNVAKETGNGTAAQRLLTQATKDYQEALIAIQSAENLNKGERVAARKAAQADYERLTLLINTNKEAVRALAEQEVAAAKTAAAARAASIQGALNNSLVEAGVLPPAQGAGASGATYSAMRDAAAAEDAQAIALARMRDQASRLEASIHPLNAAMMEMNATQRLARELADAGVMSEEVAQGVIAAAATKYENLSAAMNENLRVSKLWTEQARAAQAQLAFNDVLGLNRPSATVGQGENVATFSELEKLAKSGAFKDVETGAKAAAGAVSQIGVSSLTVRESLVLMREAARGDFTRMAGSASLLTQSIFGASLGVVGMMAAIAAGAAVIGGFTYEVHAGGQELLNFDNAVRATGNSAGITSSRYYEMGNSIAKSADVSASSARSLELQLTRTGKVGADSMELMITDAELLARAMGEKPAAALKQLESLTGDVSKASADLNTQFNFLTESEWLEIRAMEEAGNKAGAMKLALTDLKGHLKDTAENMGYLEQAAHGLHQALDDILDRIKSIGRDPSTQEMITNLQNAIENAKKYHQAPDAKNVAAPGLGYITAADAQKQIDYLKTILGWENQAADAQAKADEQTRKGIEDDEKFGSKKSELTEVIEAQTRATKALAAARIQLANATTPEQRKAAQAIIDAKNDDLVGEANRIKQLKRQINGPPPRGTGTRRDEGGTDIANVNKATTALELENEAQERLNEAVMNGTMTAKEATLQAQVTSKWAAEIARQTQLREDIEALASKSDAKSVALRASLSKEYGILTGKIRDYKDELRLSEALKADSQVQAETQALRDQNKELELEVSLIGASNRERLVALAIARAANDNRNLNAADPNAYNTGLHRRREGVKGANDQADQADIQYVHQAEVAQQTLNQQYSIYVNTLGMATDQAEAYTKEQELLNAATQQGLDLTIEQRGAIHAIAEAYAATTEAMKRAQAVQTEIDTATNTIEQALEDVSLNGKSAVAVIWDMVKALDAAALKAVLLGQGPLAQILGTSGSGGSLGSLSKAATPFITNFIGENFGSSLSKAGFQAGDALIQAGLLHDGGLGRNAPPIMASAHLFNNAPRFHEGRLKPGEMPAIIKDDELVLNRQQQQNVAAKMRNGGQTNNFYIQTPDTEGVYRSRRQVANSYSRAMRNAK